MVNKKLVSKPYLFVYVVVLLFVSSWSGNDKDSVPPVQVPRASTSPTLAAATPASSIVATASPNAVVESPSGPQSQALEVAQLLVVSGRSSAAAYSRDAFGSAWKDIDRNGCDTRNDILARDFTQVVFKPGTHNCKVVGGAWKDPYSNETYMFDKAPSGAQIDHVVSLKNAWQMGADQWSDSEREAFANDPLNLRVTIASLNRQKSDSNAASWLPPYKPGRCSFIAQQVAVKTKWRLTVTSSEKAVMLQILALDICRGVPLPE